MRFWGWLFGSAVLATVATGLVLPLPVDAPCPWGETPPGQVMPREAVAAFADEPVDSPPDVIEAGLGRRLAQWQYTFALLPPDLRQFCVANDLGSADCRVVTHAAPLRERGLEIRFEEDDQGFLAMVHVHPFSRWRIGRIPGT